MPLPSHNHSNQAHQSLEILVLFDSQHGGTAQMARLIAEGVNAHAHCQARIRCVPKVSAVHQNTAPYVPDHGWPYVELSDLDACIGLALGSPTYFGNMSANMKYFLDQTSAAWMQGTLVGKPACVFTSTGSLHGGQESTLLSMMLPLMHHGMIITSLPYLGTGLMHTKTGGTPYGVSHYASKNQALSDEEKHMCQAAGKNLADIAYRLIR